MSFAKEPAPVVGHHNRTAVLLCNLGSPEAASTPAVRRFLDEFLSDRRVVEIPKALWFLILQLFVLRVRPAQSAKRYASIWMEEGSPLIVWSDRQAKRLAGNLGERGHQVTVRHAMRYGQPSIPQVLNELKAAGVERILVLPLYPQYASSTTASVIDAVGHWAKDIRSVPEFRFVNRFHDDPGYISSMAKRTAGHWAKHGRPDKLVMSFHGIPQRSVDLGDPYHLECLKTSRLLADALGLPANDYIVTFQSRLGRAEWLQPYTEPTLVTMAKQGVKRVDVICPGFTSDNLETLEEIAQEARDAFLDNGGETFHYIPSLNDQTEWIRALTALTERHLSGWDTQPGSDAALAERLRRASDRGTP